MTESRVLRAVFVVATLASAPTVLWPAAPGRFFLFAQTRSSDAKARVQHLLDEAQAATADTHAEALLREALRLQPGSVPASVMLGDVLFREQRLTEALRNYETALAISPNLPQARDGERKACETLALRARSAGDEAGTLQILQHARAVLNNDVAILTDLGVQAESMHRPKLAREALLAALAQRPEEARANYALARVEMDTGNFPAAETHLNTYLKQRPQDASAHYGLGRIYQMQQREDAAAHEFHTSIELKPVQSESYFQLGQMAMDFGRDDEARGYFEKTLQRMPAHGGALTGLGTVAYRQKSYADAEQWLSRAVSASPDYEPAHYYLGLTLRRLGRTEDAERELHRATELVAQQQSKSGPVAEP